MLLPLAIRVIIIALSSCEWGVSPFLIVGYKRVSKYC